MQTVKTRARTVAALLVAAAVLAHLPVASAQILEQVLVKVNGDIITKTELEAKQIAALRATVDAHAAWAAGDTR